jgi:hypothetical protein
MMRLSWLQFRKQAAVAVGLLAVVAVLLAVTGPHLAHLYDVYEKALAACATTRNCHDVRINVGSLDHQLKLLGTALVAVPAVLGAFWGAPMVAREFETGTHRLAWTQGVTRTRWLAVKLAVVGSASIAVTGLLSLMVTWWSSPIDRVDMGRFGAGMFSERNVAPLGYAAFAFALGVVAGLLIRRTLPAMAATLFVFLGVRLGFTYGVRPHLAGPKHLALALTPAGIGFGSTNSGPSTLFPPPPRLPGAWIYSNDIVDNAGHGLTSKILGSSCPNLADVAGPPPGAGHAIRTQAPLDVRDALSECVTRISTSFHQAVAYQPGSRYWLFQWYEMAIFLVAALVLVGFCLWRIRRTG